ncbi:hypothetical protein SAMN05444266_110143 [Chitinophaga jiangningensis]|uniref:Uncharacterized protein n=1 Tax=Chitinophaga jiangningensis TaxID=1419482 RepID=A0A1M7L5S4_9BACT|nr:hypothetical protein SAMN05444266_110143 [Chitinophaga jiangningensis]
MAFGVVMEMEESTAFRWQSQYFDARIIYGTAVE